MTMETNARRLPSWMMGGVVAAADSIVANEEKKSKKVSKGQVEVGAISSSARRRKRGTTRFCGDDDYNDEQCDNDDDGGVQRKKKVKRERMRNGVAKKQNAKLVACGSVSGDYIGEGEEEEEDMKLTVEDLVSIAEEYVKADEAAKKEQLFPKDCEPLTVHPVAHSSQNVLEASITGPGIDQKAEDSFYAVEYPRSEQTLPSASVSTGDPTRDMLDLLLGPLLKKPVDDQRNTNIDGNNLEFGFEPVRHIENNVGKDNVAPVKKKGSFKDKVSSLLD